MGKEAIHTELLWKIPLALLGGVTGLLIVGALVVAVCALLSDPRREYNEENPFLCGVLTVSARLVLLVSGIRLEVRGLDKLPTDRPLLMVCNHRSNYDPIVSWIALSGWRPVFVSKPSNFAIPFYGRIIHRCRFMAIDREDPRKAMATIRRAADLMTEHGANVFVYPEGTRSKDGRLLPFHAGVFKIAQKADAPVAVLTVTGTEQVHKNAPWRRTTVCLEVQEVIPAETVKAQRSTALSDAVWETMRPLVDVPQA